MADDSYPEGMENNEKLEQALAKALRGGEGRPELFRQLRASTLWFLIPYHPEMLGDFQIENGDTVLFKVWENEKGQYVPIFTSPERAERALETVGSEPDDAAVAEMKGEILFKALSGQSHGAVLNPTCADGTIYLDLNAVKMLGDGSILEPLVKGGGEHGKVTIVQPADYPTTFLQPLFRFLRERPEVRAAWLFRKEPTPLAKNYYVFGLLVKGDPLPVEKDLAVVAHSECPPETTFGVMTINPKDPATAALMKQFAPFYAAPNYKASTGNLGDL